MPGLLDMLTASQPNTAGSAADPLTALLQGTPQNTAQPSLMQLLQGPQGLWPQPQRSNGPPYGDSGFAALQSRQQPSPDLIARMLQLQGPMGIKSNPSGNTGFGLFEDAPFGAGGFQPSPEQAARMAQLTNTFPQSRNVIDVRGVPQFYPQQPLPVQGAMQGATQGMQVNPYWPRPNPGPMQRYGPQ